MALVAIKGGKATIETTRLILREAHANDLKDMHKMFGDEEVMRYWYSLPVYSLLLPFSFFPKG